MTLPNLFYVMIKKSLSRVKLYPVKEYFNLKYFAVGEPVGCVEVVIKKWEIGVSQRRPPDPKNKKNYWRSNLFHYIYQCVFRKSVKSTTFFQKNYEEFFEEF